MVEMVAQHPSSWAEHPAVNPWAGTGTGTGGTDRGTGGGQALSRAVCPGTRVAVVTAQCVPPGGGMMAGKTQGPAGKVMLLWSHWCSMMPPGKELLI